MVYVDGVSGFVRLDSRMGEGWKVFCFLFVYLMIFE